MIKILFICGCLCVNHLGLNAQEQYVDCIQLLKSDIAKYKIDIYYSPVSGDSVLTIPMKHIETEIWHSEAPQNAYSFQIISDTISYQKPSCTTSAIKRNILRNIKNREVFVSTSITILICLKDRWRIIEAEQIRQN